MRTASRKFRLTARVVVVAAAAIFAASTLSGCDALYSQLHQTVPHDHEGHIH
ncbi:MULTISPECIES: hypothetical protein [Mycobacterium]|uniref:hypothetical protein n=1 Tax=Mycobacterium TaxID=1763 RepID=UPI000AC2F049|nr:MULTISPECIES: hypothetical protein [Mycobacterium]MDP7727816.1 hypothetical protein [Mycobacterium sp. TY813]